MFTRVTMCTTGSTASKMNLFVLPDHLSDMNLRPILQMTFLHPSGDRRDAVFAYSFVLFMQWLRHEGQTCSNDNCIFSSASGSFLPF